MKKHRFHRAAPEQFYSDQLDFDEDMELNACSMTDCTGLIPAAPSNAAQAQSYEEIYSYLPPAADTEANSR
jgi:hypothetical protein